MDGYTLRYPLEFYDDFDPPIVRIDVAGGTRESDA